jgi:hypothetical protein
MNLWHVLVALTVLGGAAYTYVFQPMALELGLPRAQCWWQGGVYLRSTEKEYGYAHLMRSTPENAARLKAGAAQGCFQNGACVANKTAALGALEQQMVAWVGLAGGQLLVGNVLNMLGQTSAATARAKQAEAEYCLKYLGRIRQALKP